LSQLGRPPDQLECRGCDLNPLDASTNRFVGTIKLKVHKDT